MSQHYKADLLMRLELAHADLNAASAMLSRGNISDLDKQYLERQVSKHKAKFEKLSKEYGRMTCETVSIGYGIEEQAE